VAGGSAHYFDPRQPASIARAVTHLLEHPEKLAAMSQAGRRRAGEFSWRRVADQTLGSFAAALRAR
ncbi:MAG: glycosyltransferase family 1 protein, partial [Microbacteriaceae bacterium]